MDLHVNSQYQRLSVEETQQATTQGAATFQLSNKQPRLMIKEQISKFDPRKDTSGNWRAKNLRKQADGARRESAGAQMTFAKCYLTGSTDYGITKDKDYATYWFARAIESGNLSPEAKEEAINELQKMKDKRIKLPNKIKKQLADTALFAFEPGHMIATVGLAGAYSMAKIRNIAKSDASRRAIVQAKLHQAQAKGKTLQPANKLVELESDLA